jgi:hypothetical protein
MDSYSTLGHMEGGNSCGGHTLMRVAMTCWLMGLWSTQAKVEGVVLKAAWHWGRDCSVVNGSPSGTRPYPNVCRPSIHMGLHRRWPNIFPVFCGRAPYWGLSTDINEWKNHCLWRLSFCLYRVLVGEHGEGLIYWGLWEKGVEESSGDGSLSLSVSLQGPVGEPGASVNWEF